MENTTLITKKCFPDESAEDKHLLVVYANLVRRLNKLVKCGAGFDGNGYFMRVYNKARTKAVQVSGRYNWENYDKPNERYYVSISINFYTLTL